MFHLVGDHFYVDHGCGTCCMVGRVEWNLSAGKKRTVIMISGTDRYIERAMTQEEKRYWNRISLLDLLLKIESGSLPIVIRDGNIWGCEMDQRELDRAKEDARSFPGLSPPSGSCYIGYRKGKSGKYLYWKDSRGNYWYETERGMEFKRLMEQAKKQKKSIQR